MDLTPSSDQSVVYLNGGYMPLSEARVPVLDRGFIFGDGVYEVLRVINGRLFATRFHNDRLERSLDGVRITLASGDSPAGFVDIAPPDGWIPLGFPLARS